MKGGALISPFKVEHMCGGCLSWDGDEGIYGELFVKIVSNKELIVLLIIFFRYYNVFSRFKAGKPS